MRAARKSFNPDWLKTAVPEIPEPGVPPGHARLEVELVFRESTTTLARATSPMKLLTPQARGQSVWAYSSSFGGGLVAGDETRLDVRLGPGARCVMGTQASTKIYRNPRQLPCSHTTHARLEADSLLVFTPDPVQTYADSIYIQRQEFHLSPGANLVLLDWFTGGRSARGERWAFDLFQSRNDVFVSGERVFVDSIALDASEGLVASRHRTGRFNCFATLLMLGPALIDVAQIMVEGSDSRPVEPNAALLLAAAPVGTGALLRVAGEQTEEVRRQIQERLAPLCELLGDDPWARKG
jgi:urease accessory protein